MFTSLTLGIAVCGLLLAPVLATAAPTGKITEFSAEFGGLPRDIGTGPDGNLWFTDPERAPRLQATGRVTPSGTITEFDTYDGLAERWPSDIIAADNVPARQVDNRSVVIGRCKTTDSPSTTPQWHFNSRFTTPNGKEPVHSVRPGGLARFTAQVAGGNVDSFGVLAALVYYSTPGIKIPKRGSHPEWSPAGGLPHWAVKNLCHWKNKRNISFLVKFGSQSKIGQKACLGLQLGAKTREVPDDPPVKRYCLKVK